MRSRPAPSRLINALMRPAHSPFVNRCLTPRRFPLPSSPTVPTNKIDPAVSISHACNAFAIATKATNPQASSAMPGANNFAPTRRRVKSVSTGKTVSRCALTTSSGVSEAPCRSAIQFPSSSRRALVRPAAANFWRRYSARSDSPNGGAGMELI